MTPNDLDLEPPQRLSYQRQTYQLAGPTRGFLRLLVVNINQRNSSALVIETIAWLDQTNSSYVQRAISHFAGAWNARQFNPITVLSHCG